MERKLSSDEIMTLEEEEYVIQFTKLRANLTYGTGIAMVGTTQTHQKIYSEKVKVHIIDSP